MRHFFIVLGALKWNSMGYKDLIVFVAIVLLMHMFRKRLARLWRNHRAQSLCNHQ